MELRLVKVVVPGLTGAERESLLGDYDPLSWWHETDAEGQVTFHVLLRADRTEALMDQIEKKFADHEGFRMVVLPVEASVPRAPAEEEEESPKPGDDSRFRVSREELYASVTEGLNATPVYVAFALLSALVAAIGFMRDDLAVVIGAMVIAPLLQPNVALSLATTLGDLDLGRRALQKGVIGVGAALVLSVLFGMTFSFDPSLPAIAGRTQVALSHILLALAAGAAGALAYTAGLSGAVIGVMVAVALMPPLVAAGMLLGAGHWNLALGAGLLTLTNLICINLAGVLTFLVQGVRPLQWWEAKRARRATVRAIAIWSVLLVALAALIWFAQRHG